MRQFDVYRTPFVRSASIAPFLVVMQSHFLVALPTVLTAPLLRPRERPAYSDVSVGLRFQDDDYVLSLAELAVVDARALQRAVGSLADHEDAIRRALERVFTGF